MRFPTDRRNGLRFALACLVWAVVFVASSRALRGDDGLDDFAGVAIAVVCVGLGLVCLAMYRKFVLEADELARRIQLEGVAFGFGAGLLFALTYGLFNDVGAPDVALTHVGTVLIFGYIAGVFRATFQYS